MFPLDNVGESTAVVQRYQTKLKDEVGLVITETKTEDFDHLGINEWNNHLSRFLTVNVPLMKGYFVGNCFYTRKFKPSS